MKAAYIGIYDEHPSTDFLLHFTHCVGPSTGMAMIKISNTDLF